ncbi:hypothetical protein DMB42_52115 [Nonomuraea sp. WAC 01424]|uniref:hypothetical protein n=1 Tax=Nonomuraea sp. WAC 01424 TaxID=2203200 RepID=UPI000F7AA37A|nr:hypothetical protein [Nonomuraea sp. WAC 01424]RSM93779.1 hypothetical protein DMB42_52115 [Nonomuraea sp. WAC 01424]
MAEHDQEDGPASSGPVYYERWSEVPWDLASKSQLAGADLPREPGGPVVAYVAGQDWRGKDAEIPLYRVADCLPTRATAGQLVAAARRATATVRTCADCGAQCQQGLAERGQRPRCIACSHIARLVAEQIRLREKRVVLADWARDLLADAATAVVWVTLHDAPRTPAGRARPPLAARVQAVDGTGARLLDVLMRLAGPRTAGAPDDAVSASQGAAALMDALDGRRLVGWNDCPLSSVRDRLAALGSPVRLSGPEDEWLPDGWRGTARHRVAQWRGELDPLTGWLRSPWPPGSADRLWLLLRRMADTTVEAGRPGLSAPSLNGVAVSSMREPVRLTIRGSAAGTNAMLEALTRLGVERAVVAATVPARDNSDQHVTYMTVDGALDGQAAGEVHV